MIGKKEQPPLRVNDTPHLNAPSHRALSSEVQGRGRVVPRVRLSREDCHLAAIVAAIDQSPAGFKSAVHIFPLVNSCKHTQCSLDKGCVLQYTTFGKKGGRWITVWVLLFIKSALVIG
jgi:hypothetical protein